MTKKIEQISVAGIPVDLQTIKYKYTPRRVSIDAYDDHIGEADPVNNYGFEFTDTSKIVELYIESNQNKRAIHNFVVRFLFDVEMTEDSEDEDGYFPTLEGYEDGYYNFFFATYDFNVVPVLEVYVNEVNEKNWPLVMAHSAMLPFGSGNETVEYVYAFIGGILPDLAPIVKAIQDDTMEYGATMAMPVVADPVYESGLKLITTLITGTAATTKIVIDVKGEHDDTNN